MLYFQYHIIDNMYIFIINIIKIFKKIYFIIIISIFYHFQFYIIIIKFYIIDTPLS